MSEVFIIQSFDGEVHASLQLQAAIEIVEFLIVDPLLAVLDDTNQITIFNYETLQITCKKRFSEPIAFI